MDDLKLIKKHYGEKMMHLTRELFPSILEQKGLLFSLLESNFQRSRNLAEDIINNELIDDFKNYIYSLIEIKEDTLSAIKKPKELLDEAGYNFYECLTDLDIKVFEQYYSPKEKLCTFKGERLKHCYVFFAVKKNVNEIKRENFPNPKRQDEYGTSVISIQFSKGKINTLSIKNRYNHTVKNPDATFSNNLENIIEGLTKSFETTYNLNINQNEHCKFELPGYVKANDGKYYKYNYEINNIYYCVNNVIIDNFQVRKNYTEKEKYLIIDYFIIDLVNKTISTYDKTINDSFLEELKNIKKIEINKQNNIKQIKITLKDNSIAFIEVDKYNRIISYKNDSIETIEDDFLSLCKYIQNVSLNKVTSIKNNFLKKAKHLKKIELLSLKQVKNSFIINNMDLEEINFPSLEITGINFIAYNQNIKKVSLPSLKIVGDYFLCDNRKLESISLPNVTEIRNSFIINNEIIKTINLDNVIIILNEFLRKNKELEKIYMPKVKRIGRSFLASNETLKEINQENIEYIGRDFLKNNTLINNKETNKKR